ncbi:serine/threonine protein kinase [Arthrobacter sp. 24S4-2]|uniref:serine/threonine-protein kinase n=1 Tax=Arthrobacter sp. 24S4-2 TaxID=2575374 RepID=UPI0010C7AA13|nr:serine/threonine-protein kinase [Arthrobacter sp. 24S4-2]QCO97828.1 serine/threonine protein kinase [Arthrobacter sp. 24S4-2]
MDKFENDGGAHQGGQTAPAAGAFPGLARRPAERPAPVVPGYAVGRELGRGGSATVWLVSQELTLREFAVKCFDPPGAPQPPDGGGVSGGGVPGGGREDAEDAVRREVRILSALDHDHLVKVHDVVRLRGTADGALVIVMDYAAGGSLGQLVSCRGALSVGETVTVLTPIAQVLAYLHGKGFMHSDVSPGNILFSAHGKPLLADLGVTRMVGDAVDLSRAGTEGFLDSAPVDAVRAGLQPERDVYSAAAIGWYCLTGKAPEAGAGRPPLSLLVPGVPAALAAALEAGLRSDRRERPTAAEFAAAVFRSADAAPVDLAGAVHPTVLPQLLTRRNVPPSRSARRAAKLRSWRRRLGTSGGTARRPARSPGRHAGRNGRRMASIAAALVAVGIATAWLLAVPQPAAAPDAASVPAGLETGFIADGEGSTVPADVRDLLLSQKPDEAARGLAWLRSAALSSGKLGLLDEVNAGNSPAADADSRISGRLRESGHVLAGFGTTLTRTEAEPGGSGTRAVVAVTAVTSGYQETDAAGTVVAVEAAGSEQQLRLVLVSSGGRWRIQEILPAA